ncbi:hypothetical protein F9B74_00115 [Pelistega sp. NLN82]|uniref:Uncharacterized protein n=1 Tax=Pelistega ratti TaxID=2652177 RepID=A0A6L9Y4M3_9BURK|nr:hypothetical protein [Pelistega ratti]NEN74734.1 hypothetical protein [Pelistega ratti]
MMELKSYLTENTRAELIAERVDDEVINLEEAIAAADGGDFDTAWRWLARNELPDYALKLMKEWYGADFIRDLNCKTINADRAYGENWLNE